MTGKTISLTVNGKAVTASVEPRMHLADYLREQLLLTGTHLGCEHGVCGACTLLIDGEIARSCIAYAVSCDGADIRTIEDFDDDALMAELRRAFSREHGLQCGYCTPAMLITARDIVTRLPDADDERIRVELSGNLCRCTGYVGIVKAIRRVLDQRRSGAEPRAEPKAEQQERAPPISVPVTASPAAVAPAVVTAGPESGLTRLSQSFTVRHPRPAVWAYFADIGKVAACMPGASVSEAASAHRVAGQIDIKLGPIRAAFAGEGEIERDEVTYRGVIRGSGRDKRSASRAKGEVAYVLVEADGGQATRVEVSLGFSLAGPLAQFSRGGIVNDLADRLTAEFARNLQANLDQTGAESSPARLDAGSLLLSVLWARIKAFFAALSGRA